MAPMVYIGFAEFNLGSYEYAIYENDVGMVKRLLNEGQDPYNGEPFFWASRTRNPDLVGLIAEAQMNAQGVKGVKPDYLLNALPTTTPINPHHMRCFEMLMDLIPDKTKVRPIAPELFQRAYHLEASVIRYLLDQGLSPDYRREKNGNTILHDTAREGNLEVLKILVKRLPDVNVLNAKGDSPLRSAVDAVLIDRRDHIRPCIDFLLQQGARAIPDFTPEEKKALV